MVSYSKQTASFFLFIFLLFTVIHSLNFPDGHENSSGIKVDLIHRHHLERRRRNGSAAPPLSQLDRLKQLLHSDTIRVRAISQKVRLKRTHTNPIFRRQTQESNITYHPSCTNGSSSNSTKGHNHNTSGELAINSAADYGIGQYFVRFRVGSPAQKFVLIVDTGSDLTWMNCKYRCHGDRCRRNSRKRRVFHADDSSSFRTVPCSSSLCKFDLANLFSLTRCPSPMDPCEYDYRYSDGSNALGLFANESITFSLTNGRKTRLDNVLVGCSRTSQGPSFQHADGVMGLGYSNYSFALKAATQFGGKFSYCLVDHLSPKNISSYLIFGSHKHALIPLSKMRYTELVLGAINPFYAVNLKAISIGGVILEIPPETWDSNGGGGTIIDSGTSLTFLSERAYQPVMAALKSSLLNFKNLNLDNLPMEYCFNSTGFNDSSVPRLVFHFADGARFEPPVKSYVIEAITGVRCLGFMAAASPGISVIGNIMQQNHLWEFDVINSRLGFAASTCS